MDVTPRPRMTFDRVADRRARARRLPRRRRRCRPGACSLTPRIREGSGLTARQAIELFEDQVTSRAIDVAGARAEEDGSLLLHHQLRRPREQRRRSGATLRITDPAFLHYRSGALMMARARQLPGMHARLRRAARHRGQPRRARSPRGGTRCGAAVRCGSRRRPPPSPVTCRRRWAWPSAWPARGGWAWTASSPRDAVVLCSFGDASANHATALAAINTARYAARIGLPMPILFVCEDNGTGISVPTPDDWIAETFAAQPHLRYVLAVGELDEVWDATAEAVHYVRSAAPAGLPAPAHGAAVGPCRQRRGARLPHARPRSRPTRHGIRCCATRAGWSRPVPSRRPTPARPGGRDARARDGRRRGGRPPAAAGHHRGGGRPHGAVPPVAGGRARQRGRC